MNVKRFLASLASFAGHALRVGPGIAGPVAISVGAAMLAHNDAVGIVVGGVFLLGFDVLARR